MVPEWARSALPVGLLSVAGLVVVAGRGLTFGYFRAHDLLDVGLGERAPFGLPGAEAGCGSGDIRAAATGDVRAVGTGGRRGRRGNGGGLSIAARAERSAEIAIGSRARRASRRAACRRWRISLSATPATL